jgi:ankyrin repeat protein
LFDIFSDGPCSTDVLLEARLKQHALLDYAALHWDAHARGDTEQTVETLALKFLTNNCRVSCCTQIMLCSAYRYSGYSQIFPKNFSGLHLCAYLGLHKMIEGLLKVKIAVDCEDSSHRTPLSWAAARGHETVARLLVERDDVAADSKDDYGQTLLSWPAREGHEAVVRLLAKRNDVAADSKDKSGQTPLSWAAAKGQETMVRLLVERGDVAADSKDDYGQTPLSWAAREGHEAVVRLLAK